MKNNVLKLVKYLYYFSLALIPILYLFPGSLIGYLLFGDLGKQPDFIPNPIGTSINHALAFFYLSILGLISQTIYKSFSQTAILLVSLSIVLELLHFYVPNRSFELLDLFGNLLGTILAVIIFVLYKSYKKNS